MQVHRLNKISVVFLLWFSGTSLSGYSQDKASAISTASHREILNVFQRNADEHCARNLNRFGLSELQKYDRALDSLFAMEKKDTLASIQKIYAEKVANRKSETEELKTRLEELSRNKEIYTDSYHRLLRKAGITFVIWIVVVLLMLRWRKWLVRRSEQELEANLAQLKTSEHFYNDGEELSGAAAQWQNKISVMNPVVAEIQKSVFTVYGKLNPELSKSDSFKVLQKNSEAIQSNTNLLTNLANGIVAQHGEPGEEKKLTNINLLCEQYADLAYNGTLNDDGTFPCQLSKDFEKNLPSAKIIPEAVGSLLLNILSNAFQSVNTRAKQEIKGYVPKVSISTRILPRFVQIRVKDNGLGVPDQDLELIYEPFYTTRDVGEGAGLGLTFSEQIIRGNNGELKIESEKGNGTDVYIKFFLQSQS